MDRWVVGVMGGGAVVGMGMVGMGMVGVMGIIIRFG